MNGQAGLHLTAPLHMPRQPKSALKSKTLRWHMPIIGEVPMMFYVPECGEEYEDIKRTIEENGGLVVE